MRALPEAPSVEPHEALFWNTNPSVLPTCETSISDLAAEMSASAVRDCQAKAWLRVEYKAAGHHAIDQYGLF